MAPSGHRRTMRTKPLNDDPAEERLRIAKRRAAVATGGAGLAVVTARLADLCRRIAQRGANVPSSNAALYANEGLPPFPVLEPPVCP
jgi:hypothetical protein